MHGSGSSPLRPLRKLPVHLSLLLTLGLAGQAPPQNQAEMATHDEPATFRARVNLVLVPVVVRDRQWHALGSLKQEDRPIARPMMMERPDVSYYLADMIQNKNDPMALQAAIAETMTCMQLDVSQRSVAEQSARVAAQRALISGEQETRTALRVLMDVVRRMSAMPGQRTIVLVSPGFLTPELQQEKTDILDRAIRSNVIVSSLDARGLYTDSTMVSGLFDRNGNYVTGIQKRIEMRLLDETLENRLGSGLTVRTSFDVKPGSYMIRVVVRDDEGQLMAAENGAVEIP
jgi:hypothetical protein